MKSNRSRWIGPALAVIVAGLWLASRARAPGPSSPAARPGATVGPTSPEPAAGQVPASRPQAAPPPVSASAPPGCPEDDADPAELLRPSVWELLRTRTQELRDRLPQLSRDASPELRAGLNGLDGDDPAGAVDRIRAAPDRERDGFDIAVAAALHLGMRALARGDADDARRWGRIATHDGDGDPLTHALASLSSASAPREALAQMRRAFSSAPEEPALALSLARLEADSGHFRAAAEAATVYLREAPDDARLESWRGRMASRAELTATHARRAWSGIEVLWPAREVDPRRADELMEVARDTLLEVGSRIGLAPRRHLVVVVYRDLSELRRATCAPSWSGGIFDGVLHLDAATVNGSRWARVVRHESTHAQIALSAGEVPTWLNEGLAQHMEGEPSQGTLASWRRMSERSYWIPFASLEGELIVIDDPEDAGLAYHQSLAMVLLLEQQAGREALRDAFSLVAAGEPRDLLGRLAPRADGPALLALMTERAPPRGE